MKNLRFLSLMALGSAFIFSACKSKETSSTTGWEYNKQSNGGFQKVPYYEQITGPGLILIEGGTFTMGRTEQDVMFDWNNIPRRVTVSSFYMDQFEITNFNWLEYLYWNQRTYKDYPMIYKNALPDTNVWRSPLGFNEKFVEYYLRHPSYRDYPVVGVTWLQANDYCNWRTDRVNELILIEEGILEENPYQDGDPFTTESYMVGQYEVGDDARPLRDYDPDNPGPKPKARGRKKYGTRLVRMEDGILLPRFRLPTEAEWEFAYYGLIGNMTNPEVISDRRTYPWNGHWVRQDDAAFSGDIRANFMRGRGDYMGVAGHLNDNADVTAPVDSYWPNDYGLYNMAGNVSEWVMDVYRPLSHEDFDDFRPFRGNVFKTKVLNNAGMIDTKNTQVEFDVHGLKQYVNEFERVRFQRISAAQHDPDDPNIPAHMSVQNASNHRISVDGQIVNSQAPDQFYVSSGRKKDEVELEILRRVNIWLDSAISLKNLKYDVEASMIVTEEILANIFDEELREGPDEEYAFEIISMLRDGFADYVVNTPGRLKWRNEVEEENIGRLNYRRADYIDYKDGDIESSIYYENNERKNDINMANRDPNLVMYQSQYEEFDLQGNPIAPFADRTSWPTTLISDKSRVYKGGAWNDRGYWVSGGTRRFLDEDKAMSSLGFRCAMDRVGSPTGLGNDRQPNNKYSSKKKKKKK